MDESESDAELVTRAVRGDLSAFDLLFERYYGMVYGVSFRLSGTRENAEDIAQQTFVKAARALGSFRGDAKMSTWLYRIAANTAFDWRKQQARERRLRDAMEALDDTGSAGDDISREILEGLAQLSPREREAVVLVFYEGLTHAETAKLLECAETTVSWRIFRAKKKLKDFFAAAP